MRPILKTKPPGPCSLAAAEITCRRSKRTRKNSARLWPLCSKSRVFPPPPTALTRASTRERNRGRREIRVLTAREVTPAQVGFPGACTIAKLVRRIRRKQKVTTETVYLITSLTLAELDARG